jgi:hypothetical protein
MEFLRITVGAYAESESEDGYGIETGRFEHHAEGEATIRENRIEPILNIRLANHYRILAPSAEEFPRLSQSPISRLTGEVKFKWTVSAFTRHY